MKIVGYSDPLSVAPGDTIRFMVSTGAPSFEASIVRLGGRAELRIPTSADGNYPGREQPLRHGSYVEVPDPPVLPTGGFTVEARIWPTAPGRGVQALISRWTGGDGWALILDETGALALRLGRQTVSSGTPLRGRAWYVVAASYDAERGRARVAQRPVLELPRDRTCALVEADVHVGPGAGRGPLLIAALGEPPEAHFNGKIDGPRLLAAPEGSILAAWDFGRDFSSPGVADVSGNGRHGRTVNMPTRAVTGWNWSGRETSFALAPGEYGAIHFHDDDLEDACWKPSFALTVPEELRSGVYAALLRAGDAEDRVPFFVRPPRGRATASAAFVAPTLSYLAYANEHASWAKPIPATPGIDEMLKRVGPADRYAEANRLLSIYELHSDGSGACYASRLRPLVNMRPDYVMPLLDGPHQFPADLELLMWLEADGHAYDVVTDDDLHAEGVALLEPYRVVLTGSHPEYWSGAMLDALEAYLGGGGRLMYLGGNGFYWVTSIDPERPYVLEVRRGHAGTRVWASAPGEVHHATTGEPGGLWRHRGRPPQRLAGVGFTAQGFDVSLPYRREPGSRDPRAAFVFEGIGEGPIGGFGSVLGGAGGFEIDRLDHELETPQHTLLLATATGFSDVYQGVVEDILTADSKQGGTVNPGVRADMVLFETPNGGAVFSTGSIAWCGALLHDGIDNDVSRITGNVLRRFAAPEPLGAGEIEASLAAGAEGGDPR